MFQVSFYVPQAEARRVKLAMFGAGAGRIGNYEHCCFEIQGTGEFRPLAGARPFLGKIGEVERGVEVKIEMVCEKSVIMDVIKALKASHPYETPAYHVLECLNF